ncbi:MAG: S-layer homology domain-containing protein [Heliobacteriaceae bacterium]|jgi:hypothetical protein|nr:S-layer homology domain-containing protein [Heliobacteriaceae bacterium]
MKKILAALMAFMLMSFNLLPALAASANIADVSANYWARTEIYDVVDNGIMTIDSGRNFSPEATVSRVDFVNSLLKVLSNQELKVQIPHQFSDVNKDTPYADNILRSQQLGLVYGYPDRTFRPDKVMLRDEAQSVISHITYEAAGPRSILNQFKDAGKIPAWAIKVYEKTINYGIYVNYPDTKELRPTEELTRAEAAVLLSRLRAKLALVKQQYKGPAVTETLLATEHLAVTKKAPSDIVKITNLRKIITEGNVLEVAFDEKFKSKDHNAGDTVYFVNPDEIYTVEGTLLIPANSKFTGKILEIKDPQWFNKNARVYVQLTQIAFPSGQSVALNAKPFTKDYSLKEGPWMTAGKLALCTLTGGALGTGAGVGFAFIPDPTKIGTGIAIGTPVGAAVGLITGLVTPGLNYNAKAGEEIKVILLEDASIKK